MTTQQTTTPARLMTLKNISKSYQLGHVRVAALRGVSLEVNEGEFVALVGPSGSGKTTLLHVCGLIDTPDNGDYALDGQDVSRLASRDLSLLRREKIGFIFQGFNLVPVLTAFENVELPLLLAGHTGTKRKERIVSALAAVGLQDLARRRPDELSGGQRQRVAIARALVQHPRLVLADEPTANLDGITAAQVIDVMREVGRARNTTFIIATHDARMSAHCDRVVSLKDGAVS